MSRQVDASDLTVLSEEDLAYVESRGHFTVVQRVVAERKRREREGVVIEEADEPYSEWTADELRDELKNRKLSTSGNKPELVERLEQSDSH
jgi:hypothetical protein